MQVIRARQYLIQIRFLISGAPNLIIATQHLHFRKARLHFPVEAPGKIIPGSGWKPASALSRGSTMVLIIFWSESGYSIPEPSFSEARMKLSCLYMVLLQS